MRNLALTCCGALFVLANGLAAPPTSADEPPPLRVLLLGGSTGSHRPAEMARLIQPPLAKRGIELTYTEAMAQLNAANLARFDALALFKDDGDLPEAAEVALLEFVEAGHGLIAIHCASHCFRNSARYGAMIGGRFASHGRESFPVRVIDAQHPAMRGLSGFVTDDETYVHNELADDLRVLMAREHEGAYEPSTWVRRQGRGRVYYTALGHDEATWRLDAFHQLLAQGMRWAAGQLADDAPANPVVDGKPGPLDPAASIQHMHLPEGFCVELFAAEPDIVKPLTMTFDERGRAWVVESVDYPNDLFEPFAGHDRIKICEDTDGDGHADKFTVFAEGLNIPTGLIVVRGGAIVALSPHIVYLRDVDGDDRADDHQVLYTGFGRADTHAVHSNFRWGPDNWIWATVGYSGGRVTIAGQTREFKQSILRFRPDASAFEVLTPTSNNTWGLGFNAAGIPFASTANNQHAVHLAIPNRYLESVRGLKAIGSAGIEDHKRFHRVADDLRQVDFHGGYTAAAGFTWLTSDTLPEHLRGRAALVCEPTGHLVHIDLISPRGAGFVARDGYNLMASSDPWTAPIETHLGPDGAIWMVDWYNYIVRHNPTPAGYETGAGNAYITPERDKSHGRIYRIVTAGGQPLPANWHTADDQVMLAELGHGNSWRREQAQRLLIERADGDQPRARQIEQAAIALLHDEAVPPLAAVHALRLLEALASPTSIDALDWWHLAHYADSSVRRAVAQAIAAHDDRERQLDRTLILAELLCDNDPQVCLAALLALAEVPDPRLTAPLLAAVSESRLAGDRWLALAAVCAAAPRAHDFLLHAKDLPDDLTATAAIIAPVAEHFARGAELAGDPRALVLSLHDAAPHEATALLAGLAAGWPGDRLLPFDAAQLAKLAELLSTLPIEAQLQLLELADRWQLGDEFAAATIRIRETLLAELSAAATSLDRRLALTEQIVVMSARNDDEDLPALVLLLDQITPRTDPELAKGILAALGLATHRHLGDEVCRRWPGLTPGCRVQALNLLLRRPVWTASLLDAVSSGAIDRGDLAVDVQQRLGAHPDKSLAARARQLLADSAATSAGDRDALLAQLLPLSERPGDATRGRAVFEQNCAKCHRLGEQGQGIGPDLTGINVRPRAAILTEIIDPNRSVEGNFRQYTVATVDGQVLAGLLISETATAVELLDSQAQRHQVLREDIDELVASNKSVMPEGFEKLPTADLVDLLEYLAAHGRFVPLALGRAATVVTTRGMFNDYGVDVERLIFPAWGQQTSAGVPFQVIDPRGETVPNAIELYSPLGQVSRTMPRSASVACGLSARAVHLLGGVAGWAWPLGRKESVSLVVRLHYADGTSEDHRLLNGVHIADYIRRVDVPRSEFAFALRVQQLRRLTITPGRAEVIDRIEFVKGDDETAPVVMAVTIEVADAPHP